MKMRIVVPDATSANGFADRPSIAFGAERIRFGAITEKSTFESSEVLTGLSFASSTRSTGASTRPASGQSKCGSASAPTNSPGGPSPDLAMKTPPQTAPAGARTVRPVLGKVGRGG
jgi:hypothetical protein